ncbi:hypothetical protein CPC08DRAFT_731344 [Agrocybe pediades]|nr:hypothetical protein CPC08DRAFT_731344 [Agrocybe pediades]
MTKSARTRNALFWVMIAEHVNSHTLFYSPSSGTRKNYWTIISTLIECSAMYTAAVLFQGVLNFISLNGSHATSFTVHLIDDYSSNAVQIISGVAPTLMVARLCVSSRQEDTEVSSADLPSKLICHVPQFPGTDMTNAGDVDLEMQQSGSLGVRDHGDTMMGVVIRTECPVDGGVSTLS